MKNILNIIKQDFRGLTGSVVGIVILIGLIVVPCLFAWFNILSNWAPFEQDMTGRVSVAVAVEDEGVEMMGMEINVGDKFREAVEANHDINWVFEDSRKSAVKGLRAGDYYAAIVVPEDFTENIMSFSTGNLERPVIQYYENEKKNAIAPRITDVVQSTLQEEIDAAFVQTLGKYASEALKAADATGLDPKKVFQDLGDTMDTLSGDLETTVSLVRAAAGLSAAADDLLQASDKLIGSSADTLALSNSLLKDTEKRIPDSVNTKPVTDAVAKEAALLSGDMDTLSGHLTKARGGVKKFNTFVDKRLSKQKKLVDAMLSSVQKMKKKLKKLGLTRLAKRFGKVEKRLSTISGKLGTLETANEETWSDTQRVVDDLLEDLVLAKEETAQIADDLEGDIDGSLDKAVANAHKSIADVRKSLSGTYGNLELLENGLEGSQSALKTLEGGLDQTLETLISVENGCVALGKMFDRLASSDKLDGVNDLFSDSTEIIAENLARPIRMKTEYIYPIDHFGSVMAPFYIVVAQWVGALLTAVMISREVRRRRKDEKLKVHEMFFGRYRLFMTIGLAQALVLSIGALLYIGLDCVHPWLFILAACVNSIVFSAIIFSLYFLLENVGLALCVIAMVTQVAGGGCTFPVEVLPKVFQVLYPFMPFRYAMDAMRECVGGMYGSYYFQCLGTLALFGIGAMVIALLLYKPLLKPMEMVEENKKKSGIMV